jgi:hypothetical protein
MKGFLCPLHLLLRALLDVSHLSLLLRTDSAEAVKPQVAAVVHSDLFPRRDVSLRRDDHGAAATVRHLAEHCGWGATVVKESHKRSPHVRVNAEALVLPNVTVLVEMKAKYFVAPAITLLDGNKREYTEVFTKHDASVDVLSGLEREHLCVFSLARVVRADMYPSHCRTYP